MSGVLYVVSTPIGNVADLGPRASETLGAVSVCYAEDTRRTGRLLSRLGISTRLRSLHAHNEAARTDEVLATLAAGEDCAIVTDAGTPAVSDPGRRVVEAAMEAGFRASPVPGPSAVPAALSVSGLPADRFTFLGFPPRTGRDRAAWLGEVADSATTVVAFEAPSRLGRTLRDLSEAGLEDRTCVLCRELTKLHEEVVRSTIGELAERYDGTGVRGEITLVIAGRSEREAHGAAAHEEAVRQARNLASEGATTREIAERLRTDLGLPRNEAYRIGLAVAGETDG